MKVYGTSEMFLSPRLPSVVAKPTFNSILLDHQRSRQAPQLFRFLEQNHPLESCELQLGGFPYLHIFSHYVRV